MSVANNNYTINSVQYTVTENSIIVDELGQNYMELTIVPDSGYTVTASDFSLVNPADPTYVSSVVFSQSGFNVLVTINLVTTAIMPGGNLDLGLCIAGVAYLSKVEISGIYNTEVQPHISPSSQTNVPYSDSGDAGDLVTLFSKTFTADADFYIIFSGVVVTQGNPANYSFEETPQFNAEGYLVSITYVVKYLFPAQSYSDDVIDFTLRSKLLPIIHPSIITSYSDLPLYVSTQGQNVPWVLYGQPGAIYNASMTDGNQTITIATNEAIQSNGQSSVLIEFPEYTGNTYATWIITLTGDLQSPFTQPNPATVYQYSSIEITVTAESSNSNITYTPYSSGNFQVGNIFTVDAIQFPSFPIVESLGGTITTSVGDISFNNEPHFGLFKEKEYNPTAIVNGSVSNSATIVLDYVTNGPIEVGSRFSTPPQGSDNLGYAVQEYEVTNVSGNNISVTPNITVIDGYSIAFYKTNGNILANNPLLDIQQISSTEIVVNFDFELEATGDRDTTFTLDLDNFIEATSIFGPFILNYDSNFSASGACCGPTTTTVYLNTNSLATATEMYLPTPGNPPATLSGSYSDGSIYRNYDGQTGSFLTPAINCPGCSQPLFLCYAAKTANDLCCGNATTVQVWVAQGETFLNNSGLYQDASLTTAAPNGFYSDNTCFNQPIP